MDVDEFRTGPTPSARGDWLYRPGRQDQGKVTEDQLVTAANGNKTAEDAIKAALAKPKKKAKGPGAKDKAGFLLTAQGHRAACSANVVTALLNDPGFAGVLRYDVLLQATIITKPYPSPHPIKHGDFPYSIRDTDLIWIGSYISGLGIIINSRQIIAAAVDAVAEQNSFNPFKDYLETLVWDKTPRIDSLFTNYFGARNDNQQEAILAGKYFMIGMVARGYQPGCQMDNTPVLEGPQGALKTSACRILGGLFFGEGMPRIGHKDSLVFLSGKVLIEIAETSAMKKVEVDDVKRFLTERVDDYRPPYGIKNKKIPRCAVFIITTNSSHWNRDVTGARRFWPIVVGKIDLDALKADRDQLHAEAVVRFKAGERWWPSEKEQAQIFNPAQDARQDRDAFDEMIADMLKDKADGVRLTELLRELPLEWVAYQGRLASAMTKAGWLSTQTWVDGENLRLWRRRCVLSETKPVEDDSDTPF